MSSHRRRTKCTWDFTAVPRGTLTRWCETIPASALTNWLFLFDALTAENHNYREFATSDRRWLAWLRCRDRRHLKLTLERLQTAELIDVAGEHILSIPAVDDVWRERAELSERKRRNRSGGSTAKIGGEVATTSPILTTQPPTEKHLEKQSLDSTAVERPSLHPHPHHTTPPLTPPGLIGDRRLNSSLDSPASAAIRLTPRDRLFWNAWLQALPDELSERARNSGEIQTTANWPTSPGAQLRAIGGTPCRRSMEA